MRACQGKALTPILIRKDMYRLVGSFKSGPFLALALAVLAVAAPGCGERTSVGTATGDLKARHEHVTQRESKVSDEAQARKERSIAILKAEHVPYTEVLPVIETEAEATRRTTEEVAVRAMALCIVALKGEGLGQEAIEKLVQEYELASAFTPNERQFIEDSEPSQYDRVQFSWRYECYWVMLWALEFIGELQRPDKICDVKEAVAILRDGARDDFLERANLRAQHEILDAADLYYRYHWACVDAQINGREAPAGLDPGVVMERHYALNWLIGYMDQEWDDVSTDT